MRNLTTRTLRCGELCGECHSCRVLQAKLNHRDAAEEMYSAIKDAIKHGRLLPPEVSNRLIAAMDKADGKL